MIKLNRISFLIRVKQWFNFIPN